jgi:cystathionine beta-lyase/cystathionine gamma-synthase
MFKGSGGLFSFEPVDQSREGVLAFCDALQVFQRGISWGGFESLVVPLKTSPADYETPRWVIRLFCGLEGVNDLKADISQAFERAGVVQGTRSSQVTHA